MRAARGARLLALALALGVIAPAEAVAQDRRGVEFYRPGSFNWSLRRAHPEAQRLFHAFDYGHAALYERLLLAPADTAAMARTYRFLVHDLLVRPPHFSVPEEAIAPHYARFAWPAMQMFDWAHVLHRQLYDVYADPRLADTARAALAERLVDAYLARTDLAFAPVPKTMDLMERQPFSRTFREAHPQFNGLIWAYHWLQVGLYEALIEAPDSAAARAGVARTLAEFRAMLDPAKAPTTMPMTPDVAPRFTVRHPRAAAIFDNLHLAHDIISDILTDARIPRPAKRALIDAQLARLRDPTVDLAPAHEHHHSAGPSSSSVLVAHPEAHSQLLPTPIVYLRRGHDEPN